MNKNLDPTTVKGFGEEWTRFDQSGLSKNERENIFGRYFHVFPTEILSSESSGFDLGCGSGRWSSFVAPRVKTLHCIDASREALEVAKRNLSKYSNCEFHHASVDKIPLDDSSMDFGFSLGVLHHIPDTESGIRSCVQKLKPGAPFLVYLYYSFDNKPFWYRWIWKLSDLGRGIISRLPRSARFAVCGAIAVFIYYPLSRFSAVLDKMGFAVENMPLSFYRYRSFYTMKTDALDRFGTPLERRFSARGIREMMEASGLERIRFSESPPFWCAVGHKRERICTEGSEF